MQSPYTIIKRPYITEKSEKGRKELNKYTFEVNPESNKTEIKSAIEDLFKVKVLKVNVVKQQGKTRNLRARTGKRPDIKKAIVTLDKGQNINIYEPAAS